MSSLPSGTVTFLFTDIEGSTKLVQEYADDAPALLARHNEILGQAIHSNQGFVFQIVGDSFSAAFHNASDALSAALDAQRELHKEAWSPAPIKVRMGIHSGEAQLQDESSESRYSNYETLARTQRIMSAGHGGQILVSQTVHDLLFNKLPDNIQLFDLGEHHLKDILQPLRLFQINSRNLPVEFPPLKTQRIINHNLPTRLTSFVGRERELAETKTKLADARLLSLIGPGGTGKTRLSIQIGVEALPKFANGVWMIELAPLADPSLIVPEIASVFQLHEVQNIPLVEILIDYLRAKEMLLILDNCEHMVDSSAQIADQLLQVCPHIKIIASSREALGIEGETVYRVPPLKVHESTRLFIERATKAEPRFQVTDENVSAIAQICSQLDGIPLAIELAAARVKVFTPEQIAERLNDRFKLLAGGSRTALPRQQTLRALIDWSYQSLNDLEKRALRHLAVFSGGWTFEAAEAVIGESEAMDGLIGLVNKSLVNVEEQEHESRYRFLETIRQYAMEKLLETGESVEARDRHFGYMLKLTENPENSMFGSVSVTWLNQMELEHDNLRTALEWSLNNYPVKALRLANKLGNFWASRDYNNEARALCKTLLAQTESLADLSGERAKIFALLAWTSITSGRHKDGRAAAEAGIELARKVNSTKTLIRCLAILALSCVFLGDIATALKVGKEAEILARQENLNMELAMILTTLAQITYSSTNDASRAKEYVDEAVVVGRTAGFQWTDSMSAYGMAQIAGMLGDLETAKVKFLESAEYARMFGNKRLVYSSQSELAHILRKHGELDEPLATYRDLLPKWSELGHRAAVAHELECTAYILIRKEEPEQAATLLGAAEAIRKMIDTPMTKMEQVEYENEVASLRSGMDEDGFTSSWAKGRAMTMEEAISLAVNSE